MKKILLFLSILWTQHAYCDAVSDALQQRLNAIRTMTATFSQIVKAKQREVSRSAGSMALARPGRFRWQTKDPMEQLIVADGKNLWVYDVDLEQVTVKKQGKSLGGTAALFLSGYNDTVSRDFEVTSHSKGSKDYFDLKSISNQANFQQVKLTFVGETLSAIEFVDQLGQHTDVTLKNIKTNPSLASKLFEFKTPKGVDVVEQ